MAPPPSTPSRKMVGELIYKRGEIRSGEEGKQRQRLTDNAAVEAALAHRNIICIEDIVHEVSLHPLFLPRQPKAIPSQRT